MLPQQNRRPKEIVAEGLFAELANWLAHEWVSSGETLNYLNARRLGSRLEGTNLRVHGIVRGKDRYKDLADRYVEVTK